MTSLASKISSKLFSFFCFKINLNNYNKIIRLALYNVKYLKFINIILIKLFINKEYNR